MQKDSTKDANKNKITDLDSLLKVLKKHGVEEFKDNGLEIKISPIKFIQKENKKIKPQEGFTEDDLYYSATKVKPKGNKK
jgi:hypothetical protein